MLVSVYMPTKNRVEQLQRAVESVLSQTHRDVELWVVNDGSTDGTAEYLRQTSAADPRLHFINNEQSLGAPCSRNLAISHSRGEFVTGLDDDDAFHERRIEVLLAQWLRLEAAGSSFSCLYTQDLMSTGTSTRVSRKPAFVNYEDMFFFNSIGNQIFTRRQRMIEAGLFDEQMPAWQDLDMFMRVVRKFGTARLVDEPLYVLELAPRDDRISVSNKRIAAAYERLSAKVANHAPVLRQGLFLQRFGDLYGYGLRREDFFGFWRFGVHARTLKRLMGILVRQTLGRFKRRSLAAQNETAGNRAYDPDALRVLMFPKHSDNPYLNTLSDRLESRGATVTDFTFKRALNERHDIVHIHWPDLHLHARSGLRAIAKHARLAIVFAVLRLRGTRIVWTIHNLKPHERHHGIATRLFPLWYPRLCSHAISMTSHGLEAAKQLYPSLRSKPSAIIPHGHYRDAYPAPLSRALSRAQLALGEQFTFLFFGNIRPYKNVPALIDAFRKLRRPDIQLVIAGSPGQTMDIAELQRLATADERIRLRLEFIPNDKVPLYMGACDVVVLPFDSILNSGSVLLALSFNRAVLAPRMGSLPETQSRVGARWITLYDGALSPQHLEQAAARIVEEGEQPDLATFDWDAIAQQTMDFYRAPLATDAPPVETKSESPITESR